MELAFETESLRTICESDAHARRELGSTVAELLKHRLADLRAATSPEDLIAGRPRVLDGTGGDHMALDLHDKYHIVFAVNHCDNPFDDTGSVDWSRVSRIKILRIDANRD